MDGRLRLDLVERLRETKITADLVLAMGTSLSGVMADTLVSTVGRRAIEERSGKLLDTLPETLETTAGEEAAPARSLGAVIINAQQTRLDGVAALRIFAKLDDVLKLLAVELKLTPLRRQPVLSRQAGDVWTSLPYDCDGAPSTVATVTVDLTQGRRVVMTDGNAPLVEVGTKGVVGPKTRQGHYTLVLDSGRRCHLGAWMLDDAKEGRLPRLPIVNC